MHIVKNQSKRTFVGFGLEDIERQIDILDCFVGDNDLLLFQHTYTKPDQLDANLREELMKSCYYTRRLPYSI